jgi:hypothetical protein
MILLDPSSYKRKAVTDNAFRTLWNMTSTDFTLLTTAFTGGVFDYYVDWGDGSEIENVTSSTSPTHTYPSTGQYEIKITGSFPRLYINDNATHRGKLLKVLSWGDVNFRTFQNAFFGCNNLSELPNGSITGADSVSASAFEQAFRGCSALSIIPADMFRLNTLVSTNGFKQAFRACALTSIPTDLFRYNTAVSTSGFEGTFLACSALTSLPVDLFRYNILVSTAGFATTFFACTSLASVPTDLFRYNPLVSTYGFNNTFNSCTSLASVPTDLFRYNPLVSTYGFNATFKDCNKLKLNKWIFFAPGEENTRFLNKASNFTECFSRTSFTGIQGEAPELWNCDFGTATPIKTSCFAGAGNSLTSLSNYNDIPNDWK